MNPSLMSLRAALASLAGTLPGKLIAASFVRCLEMMAKVSGEIRVRAACLSRLQLNTVVMTTPSNATANSAPTREAVLLMADATPECVAGTEFMTAVVSGATASDMPSPKTMIAGKTSRQ